MKYAQVILFRKLGEFDNELTYEVRDSLVTECKVGTVVEVPFRTQKVKGVVTKIIRTLPEDLNTEKIKPISDLITDFSLYPEQIDLARFISDYYRTSMSRAIRLFLPSKIWKGDFKRPYDTVYRLIEKEPDVRGEKQKSIIKAIKANGGVMPSADLRSESNASLATISSLVKKDVIRKYEEQIFKPFDPHSDIRKEPDKTLTKNQADILQEIQSSESRKAEKSKSPKAEKYGKPILLHGVTGSGKTEIYLRQILDVVRSGKQAILLVPEIALTPQMINYFREFFGQHIALFHSKLSDGERAKEWWKVKTGFAPLTIGSRSAIFAPTENLGLIIIDEEHEWTYKQESNPYYETHQVAEKLHEIWGAGLILGSATPKAESYKKAREGDYIYLNLPERMHRNDLPEIKVVDLREEFKKKNFSIFSLLLQNKIREALKENEQIILFVNQRGMANAVVCRDCGYTEKCPSCDISLKLHRQFSASASLKSQDKLVCHYCDYTKEPELMCPECGSPYIKNVGVGTQRVEEEVHRLFPDARVVRADSDTTKVSDGFSNIYRDFTDHKYDILIGTQMIAKGLDFSKVSLIGIVLADIGLHIPDFRSSERLFQILTQVSGRCGRREKSGEVVLQTYSPNHPTIQKAANYEYEGFIENELKQRSKLNYPPYNRIIKFTIVGSDVNKLSEHIKLQQETLEDIFKVNDLDVKIVSAPAMVAKKANRYYYHVLLRADDPNIIFRHWKPPKGWRIDVDPVHTT